MQHWNICNEMGQVYCKRCSIGTFVSEQQSPGTKAADCVACPYGKYRFASGKLHLFSIKIRFGWHLVLIKGLSQQFQFVAIYFKRNAKISYFKKSIHLLRQRNRKRDEMNPWKSLFMNALLSLLRKETFLPRYDLQRDCWISCMQMPTQLLSVGSFWPVHSMSAKRFCLWERYSNTCS